MSYPPQNDDAYRPHEHPVVPGQSVPAHDQAGAPPYQPGSSPVSGYPGGSGPAGYPTAPYQPGEPTMPMAQGAPYAPPASGMPSSGGPGYPFPGQGYGEGHPAHAGPMSAPTGPPSRRGGFVAVAVVAALLLVATGVMTALYVAKAGEADRTRRTLTAQVASRDTTISENTREIDQLKRDLQAKTDELEDAKQDLTGSQNQVTELERQKQVIANCIRLLAEDKDREAEPFCAETERILGF